ncbi:MAG TPA: hypothetical protein VHZ30_05385 [Verrucomicrobiae bacterium]|jgi:uncharacterized lipoprotein YmbA|nr:hypothetical protein [Verrucomicrobiae bacterium]
MKTRRQLYFLALVVAMALAGCGENPVWKRQTFDFNLPSEPPASVTRTNLVALSRVMISSPFESSSFTYRTADDAYEQDPYAGFLAPPERGLAEAIRAWMRKSGSFGTVIEPGSGLVPSLIAEATVTDLCGDFRKSAQPTGSMTIHFILYAVDSDGPRNVLLDKICARQTPLTAKTPAALIAAWDTDLREIMEEINSDAAKVDLTAH